MADEDWTLPKALGTEYSGEAQRDHDKVIVTRGFVMWLLREVARLSAAVQTVELANADLKNKISQQQT